MPLYLNPDESRSFRDLNQLPGPHLDLIGAMAFRAAGAAQRLGVFEALAGGPLPPGELAARLGAAPEPLAVLLDALVSFGYLSQAGPEYANGPAADPWLDRSVPWSYAAAFTFWQDLLAGQWDGLEDAIRTGRPAEPFYAWLERRPATLRDFQSMLARMAEGLAPEVVRAAPEVTGHLLDLGGGHARYPIALCQANPGLTATILDLPGSLAEGRARVEAEGLADRITLTPGDLAGPLDGEYDAVLLFNVIHGLPAQGVKELFERVAGVLRPGGSVLVLEPFTDLPESTPAHVAAFLRGFSLNLAATQGGRLYSSREVTAWLSEAGFDAAERRPLGGGGPEELVVAALPARSLTRVLLPTAWTSKETR